MSTWRTAIAGVVCSLVAALVYLNTLECGIVFDDEPAIKKNLDLRPNYPWSNLLWHDFWGAPMDSPTSHKSYRPLCVATFRLNYLVHELEPMGYHLVNVLLHSAVCYLYVLLCGVIFGDVWPALIAGLLFAVHPIHTEAVAGLVGRTELLSGIFFIGAFLAYRKAVLEGTGYKWMILTLLMCLCSVLSKEQGITVIAVCLAYEFLVLHKMDLYSSLKLLTSLRSGQLPVWFKQVLKRVFTLAVFTLVFLFMRIRLMHGGPTLFNKSINPPLYLDTPYRHLSWMYLYFVNSWLLLNPIHLCADWRFGAVPMITSVLDPHNILTLAAISAVIFLGLYGVKGGSKQQKVAIFGLLLTLFPYIPASNLFFPVGFVVAERVLYLPSMGFCLLVGYGLWRILQFVKNRFLKVVILLLFLCLLAIHSMRIIQRNQDWRSNFTLYSSGAKFNPHNGVMLTNLGIQYAHMKNYSYAEHLYKTAVEVAPEHSRGYANLGGLMEALKRYDEAEWALRKAIELGAEDNTGAKIVETYAFLINNVILRNESRIYEALELCETALETYPNYAQLYTVKGSILLKLNRTQEAISSLDLVVQSNLMFADAYHYLGLAHVRLEDKAQGEKLLRRALQIDPNHKLAMLELGILLQSSGQKLQEAEKHLMRVVSMEPRNTEAMFGLAQVYADLRNYQKAAEMFQKGLQLSPRNKNALYKLGSLYYKSGKYSDAVSTLKKLAKMDPKYLDSENLLRSAEKQLPRAY